MTSISCSPCILFFIGMYRIIKGDESSFCPGMVPMKLTDSLRNSLDDSVFWTVAHIYNYNIAASTTTDDNADDIPKSLGFYSIGHPLRMILRIPPNGSTCYTQSYYQNDHTSQYIIISAKHKYTIEEGKAVFKTEPQYRVWYLINNAQGLPVMWRGMQQDFSKYAVGLIHVGANGNLRIYQSCNLKYLFMQISDEAKKNHTAGEPYDKQFTDEMIGIVSKYGMDPNHIHYIQSELPFEIVYRYYATRSEMKLYTKDRNYVVIPEPHDPIELMAE